MTTPFRWLAAATALSAYLQISLGGVVRVSGSGLGCGSRWPPCGSSFLPPPEAHAIIEYSHRVFGALTSVLMLATAVGAWLVYRHHRPVVAWLATAALAVVALEIPLGGLVVFKDLAAVLVLAHLAVALAILGLLVATAVLAQQGSDTGAPPGYRRLIWVAAAFTFLMLMTGSTVVASGAAEACHAWPLCGNGLQPDFSGANAYTMLHRVSVAGVGLLLVGALWAGAARHRGVPGLRTAALGTLALFGVQAAIGAGAALAGNSALFDGLHVAVGTAMWAGVVATASLTLPRQQPEAAGGRAFQLERRPA